MNIIDRKLRKFISSRCYSVIITIIATLLLTLYSLCVYSEKCDSSRQTKTLMPAVFNETPISLRCYLFLLIATAPKGFDRRKAMRETWLKDQDEDGLHIERRFFVGTKSLPSSMMHNLQKEQEQYGDLLFLTEHEDSYQSLTSKILKSMVWTARHVNATFVMKVDDDSFVVLKLLLRDLKDREHLGRTYWGFFRGNANVKHVGAWAEPRWMLCDYYLPYALGGGYIISMDLVEYLARVSDMLQLYNSEDVSVGVWLAPVKLNRIHDIRFDTEYKSRGCNNKHIVSHKQNPEDMYEKFDQLTHKNQLCKKEYAVMNSFDYRWDVPPSKCCERKQNDL